MATQVDYRKYRIWFTLFPTVLFGGFFIAILAYGEPFLFWGNSVLNHGAFGAFIAMFPHKLGAGFLVGSIWSSRFTLWLTLRMSPPGFLLPLCM